MENCHHLVLAAQWHAAAERVQQNPSRHQPTDADPTVAGTGARSDHRQDGLSRGSAESRLPSDRHRQRIGAGRPIHLRLGRPVSESNFGRVGSCLIVSRIRFLRLQASVRIPRQTCFGGFFWRKMSKFPRQKPVSRLFRRTKRKINGQPSVGGLFQPVCKKNTPHNLFEIKSNLQTA